jgi:hypothetical protein
MRTQRVLLLLLVVFLCGAIQSQDRPRPIDRVYRMMDARANLYFPPPVTRKRVDPAAVKAEADELANLAQTIPAQIDQVEHGMLPKDLAKNLKRIDKLTKHLRRELNF